VLLQDEDREDRHKARHEEEQREGLGDVSLEQISFQTKGVKFLLDFPPTIEYEQAIETERRLIAGIEQDGFVYRSGLAAEENKTYFLFSTKPKKIIFKILKKKKF